MTLKIGIQLYSVRESLQKDPYGTLEELAKSGYKYVEAANHNAASDPGVGFGLAAPEMKQLLDNMGLKIIGSHINPLKLELLDRILDYHAEIGNKQIGCDIMFFPYGDRDFLLRQCDLFNQVGEMCKRRGMRFYYHNHYQEFQQFGDSTVYDFIMENTDPALVFVEMDTYWMIRGGKDPIEIIKKYNDRLVLIHQKDFPKQAPQPLVVWDGVLNRDANITMDVFRATLNPACFTEIGTGILPIQKILDAASLAPNLEYFILEQDHSQLNEIDSIKTSMSAFRKFSGITWD